jgi:predicted hydrocarbon binding protein
MDTREIVGLLADLAEQFEMIVGENGTISVFRYAGKQLGKRIGKPHEGGDASMARELITKFFHDKEFMSGVVLDGDDATLSGCKIGLVLREGNIDAGKHALCNFGYGLIDGTIEAVTG